MYRSCDMCTLKDDSNDYYRLEMFCKMLNRDSPNGHIYVIKDVYFDIGQNWMWTTIIDTTADCQILSPRDWVEILNEERQLSDIEKDFFEDKYCQDKPKKNN